MDGNKERILSMKLCTLIEEYEIGDEKLIDLAKSLAKDGANVNFRSESWKNNTLLNLAVLKEHCDLIQILLSYGADLTLLNDDGMSAIDLAMHSRNEEIIQLLQTARDRKIGEQTKLKINQNYVQHVEFGNSLTVSQARVIRITECPTIEDAKNLLMDQIFLKAFHDSTFSFIIAFEIIQDDIDLNPNYFNISGKPVVIQVKSMKSNKFNHYYMACNSENVEKLEENQNSLFFPYVNINEDLLATKFDMKDINILSNAIKSGEEINVRFLSLFDWNLYEEILSFNNPLYVALTCGTEQQMICLFNIPFVWDQTEFKLRSDGNLLSSMKDPCGNNFLMIATQHGNINVVKFLIRFGVDINELNKQQEQPKSASDIAWEKGHIEILTELLKWDAHFPINFDLSLINENFNKSLKQMVDNRTSWHHDDIKNGNMSKVEKYVEENPQLKFGFNINNDSALKVAYQYKQCKIIAYLQSRFYSFDRNENSEAIKEKFTQNQKLRLEKLNFFKNPDDIHIMSLVSASRLSSSSKNEKSHFAKVRKMFEDLDEIPEISPILKTVAYSGNFEIIFDFNNDSVREIDPTANHSTKGNIYYALGHIYIAAKRSTREILGTIAHELTHLAMQLMYYNGCEPYHADDYVREKEFQSILLKYESTEIRSKEDIINRVYTSYNGDDIRRAELIVRIPHLLAQYNENQLKINELKSIFPELFEYFYNKTFVELQNAYKYIKDEIEIREFNKLMGVQHRMTELIWSCNVAINDKQKENLLVFKSNVPILALDTLFKDQNRNSINSKILLTLEQFANKKNKNLIKKVIRLKIKPKFYILHEASTISDDILDVLHKKIKELLDSGLCATFIINNNVSESNLIYSFISPHIVERTFVWNDLTEESQLNILSKQVGFRNQKIALNKILHRNSEMLQSMPLHEILDSSTIFVDSGNEIKTNLIISYVPRTFQCKNQHCINLSFEENGLIDYGEQEKIVVLVQVAGSGKTTTFSELRRMIHQRNPKYLIALVDLKLISTKLNFFSEKALDELILENQLEDILNIKSNFERKLLKQFLNEGKVILMLDGFDEIESNQRDFVKNFAKAYRRTTNNQLWIASRLHYVDELEKYFKISSVNILPFTEQNQVDFLVKFWQKSSNSDQNSLKNVAQNLVTQFSRINRSEIQNFTGIPMQLRMLAELFNENFTSSSETFKNILTNGKKINLFKFYNLFVNKLTMIWITKSFIQEHPYLDLYEILGIVLKFHRDISFYVNLATTSYLNQLSGSLITDQMIVSFGILQKASDTGKYFFSHQTFEEYFKVDFMLRDIESKLLSEKLLPKSCNSLISAIVYPNLIAVRRFLNDALNEIKFKKILSSPGLLTESSKSLSKASKISITGLCGIFKHLLFENQNNLIDWFFKVIENDHGMTNELCQPKIFNRLNILAFSASQISKESFSIIWNFLDRHCKETDFLMLLYQYESVPPNLLFHAVANKNVEAVRLIFSLTKLKLGNENFLLQLKQREFQDCGNNVMQQSAQFSRNVEVFDFVWEIYEKLFTHSEFKEIIFRSIYWKKSILSLAANNRNSEILQSLLTKLDKMDISHNEMKSLFISKNGSRTLPSALFMINLKNCEIIWNYFLKVFPIKRELKSELLQKSESHSNILFAAATFHNEPKVFEFIFKNVFEEIGPNLFKTLLLQANISTFPIDNNSILYDLLISDIHNSFEDLYKLIRDKYNDQDQKEIFLSCNKNGENIFSSIANSNQMSFSQKAIRWNLVLPEAKKFLNQENLNNFMSCQNEFIGVDLEKLRAMKPFKICF